MNPKKPKHFIKPTSEVLDISETLVEDVISFYWSAVRKALSELESPSVSVTNLGTFKARYKKISQIQAKYNAYLAKLETDNMTFNKHAIQNISKIKLEKLERLKKEIESEYARQKEVLLKRKEYVNNKNLEK